MGRGASDHCGASLLYGPIHRDPEARISPRLRADRDFARLLEGALDRGETSELHGFLCSSAAEDMTRRKVPEADLYANWLTDLIIGKTPARPGDPAGVDLLRLQAGAMAVIARAGATLTPEACERLIGPTVTSDLICGRGHEVMVANLDKLIRRTNFRRTSHGVVCHQPHFEPGARPKASHYRSSGDVEKAACGRYITSSMTTAAGKVRPNCMACRALEENGSSKIMRREEDTAQLIARRFEEIAEGARARVATMMSKAPLIGTDEFLDVTRREAWVSLSLIIGDTCRDAGERLDPRQLSRLRRYWTPEGDPEGSPGTMPSVAL